MQVLKKFSLILFCFAVANCSSPISLRGGIEDNSLSIEEMTLDSRKVFRVGVLLPLTGQAAKQGQGMKNAAILALDDVKNPNLVLQFYDTKSTPAGSRIAIENAFNQRADLILGPLMSSSLQAISEQAERKRVPVIAFSTSEELLKPGIYTMGLLIDEQINRVITYAAQNGRKTFALLLPDNSTGIAVAKAAVRSAEKNNVAISRIGFYPPNTSDFSEILKQMTDYYVRSKKAQEIKVGLQRAAAAGDENAKRQLKKYGSFATSGGVEYDAVLIPESGAKLKSAMAMFGYYDIYEPKVKFLGTSVWEGTALNKETVAIGSWYPALSRVYSKYFAQKFVDTFSEKPSPLYSLAYDAVALSNALAMKQNSNIYDNITNSDGYIGINGVFRIYENGSNEHSLDIYEVRERGDVVVDSAPKKLSEHEMRDIGSYVRVVDGYVAPKFYGKDEYTAQALIYGKVLPKVQEIEIESVDF